MAVSGFKESEGDKRVSEGINGQRNIEELYGGVRDGIGEFERG